MVVLFKNRRLRRQCCEHRRVLRTWGEARGRKITQRLAQLRRAPNLAALRGRPGRCHELTGGNLRGQLTLDLSDRLRLVFEPADPRVPRKRDGGLDWRRVRTVRVCAILDTHK